MQEKVKERMVEYKKKVREFVLSHRILCKWLSGIWKVVLLFDKILISPIPPVKRRITQEQRVQSSVLSLVYLVLIPVVLSQTLSADTPMYTSGYVFKYQMAGEASFVGGYILGRLGFYSLAAFQTALFLTIYYTYRMFVIAPSLSSAIPLGYFIVPYVLIVITNNWAVSVIFYIFNLAMLFYYSPQFVNATQYIPGPVNLPIYDVFQLGLQLCAIVMSMLLYSVFQHYYDLRVINKSEQRYKSFFQENSAAIAVVDENGKIMEVNASFGKMFNVQSALKMDPTKMHSRISIFNYISSGSLRDFSTLVENSHDRPSEGEVDSVRADGRTIPAHVSVKMLTNYYGFARKNPKRLWKKNHSLSSVPSSSISNTEEQDASLSEHMKRYGYRMMLVSFNDMTAHKEAQAALLRAEREKQANEAKSKFLANMSHEIRTPGVL